MNKSPIFFIEKNRGKYEFEKFPEAIYIDTCFWNEILGSGNSQFGTSCLQFLKDCVKNGTYLCTSGVVMGEMEHIIKKSFLDNYASKNNLIIPRYKNGQKNYKTFYHELLENNNNAYTSLDKEISEVINRIKRTSLVLEYKGNEQFNDKVMNIMKQTQYILGEKDAKHVAICHDNGVNSIATLDSDFITLDNQNIFTISNDKYKNERMVRANIYLEFDEDKY